MSKRQVMRLLIADQDGFIEEARDVLRAGLSSAAWVGVDDTGARHKAKNGVRARIGNDHLAWFATTENKSRLNFLDLLRAGHPDYVINAEALAYMRGRALARSIVARLAEQNDRHFADGPAWRAHLVRLGITSRVACAGVELRAIQDPARIATEGALRGSARGFLAGTLIVSDDAGQFDVGRHAPCWVHAERLAHKLETLTGPRRVAQARLRGLIWWFYRDLKACRADPTSRRRTELRARFDRILGRRTGFAGLDRLPGRLRANKRELPVALDRPEVPPHTNGSENDIRCQAAKRKVSGGTGSDIGRDCRDAFLGLAKTCAKLRISFWDYLGDRLAVAGRAVVPPLPGLISPRRRSP